MRSGKCRPGGQRYVSAFWDVGRRMLNNLMFSSVKNHEGRLCVAMQATVARAFFQAEVPANSK